MGKPPAVTEGFLKLPPGQAVKVGDGNWFDWLKSPDARSFRFEGRSGHFTARKETPKAGNPYWAAARRLNTKLHKCYLGHSENLNLARLEEAAEKLANPEIHESKKPARASDSVTPAVQSATPPVDSVISGLALNLSENQDFQQLQAQIAELHNRVSELSTEFHKSLGSFGGAVQEKGDQALLQPLAEVTKERESLKQRNAELEGRLADLAAKAGEVFEANRELKRQIAEITEERDAFSRQLAESRAENAELSRQLAATVAERDALERVSAERTGSAPAATESAPVAATESEQLRTGSAPAATTESATESAPPPDLSALRERVLAGLKLGRQAPGYRAAAKALSEFVRELELELPAPTGKS